MANNYQQVKSAVFDEYEQARNVIALAVWTMALTAAAGFCLGLFAGWLIWR